MKKFREHSTKIPQLAVRKCCSPQDSVRAEYEIACPIEVAARHNWRQQKSLLCLAATMLHEDIAHADPAFAITFSIKSGDF